MNLNEVKRVHLIGIGGIGISYLAHFFLRQGAVVSGSDVAQTPATDQLAERGVVVHHGHDASLITKDVDLVVYNDAVPEDNVERQAAQKLGVRVMNNFELVGLIAKDYTTIAIAGNKGKTTTTAMLATILEQAGCDPTVMVGSFVNEWKCNFRGGASQYLVVEADEFKEHFLHIPADVIVITNMAPDHLDYFKTPERVVEAFQSFIDKLPNDGLLVVNQDDEMTKKLKWPNCQVLTFGMMTSGDTMALNRQTVRSRQDVDVSYRGSELGRWSISMPGRFNVYNALAAATVALWMKIEPKTVREALAAFKGTWRRFEVVGRYQLATVVSDYAHHPAAVHATIEAAHDFYDPRRVVAVFQPHTRHRTQSLFNDFVISLDKADVVILPEIYAVSGRETVSENEMNSALLAQAIKERDRYNGRERIVVASGNLEQTKEVIDGIIKKDDVLLMMGAGDIYKLAEALA
jgi:UDP-N-acetylmuramate--alanine ligase